MSAAKKDPAGSTTETTPTATATGTATPEELLEDEEFFEEEYKPSEADGDMFGGAAGMRGAKSSHAMPGSHIAAPMPSAMVRGSMCAHSTRLAVPKLIDACMIVTAKSSAAKTRPR